LSKQGPLRYNRNIARYSLRVNRAGTNRRQKTQIQLETDINTLSMDQGGRSRDVGALLGAAEDTADELLQQFRRNHDRLDRKEASIRVDKSQLYPDTDATGNALRQLRHRGSDHGLDGSDEKESDKLQMKMVEIMKRRAKNPMRRRMSMISKMMTRMWKKKFLNFLNPRRDTTIEILMITQLMHLC
jgi:hypothetical protein